MDANKDEVLNHTHNLMIDYVEKLEHKVTEQQEIITKLQYELYLYKKAMEFNL